MLASVKINERSQLDECPVKQATDNRLKDLPWRQVYSDLIE